MGLGACSNLAGSYEDVIPFWNFTKDGYLYIQEGGEGKGSCIPAVYSYKFHIIYYENN